MALLDKNGLTYLWSKITSKLNNYLPKTGGTLTGNLTAPTFIGNLTGNASSASKLNTRYTQSGYTGTGNPIRYYQLAKLPIDNTSNYCSILVNGRIGGWTSGNLAKLDLVLTNRANYTGNTITTAGTIKGVVDAALNICDIVVYKQTDLSAIVYLKVSGYFLYDITVDYFQATSNYTGTVVTPVGTLIYTMSQSDSIVRVGMDGVIEGVQPKITTWGDLL